MRLHTSILRQLENPNLNRDERTLLRCRLAKELEELGNYEGARDALGELWRRIGEHPYIEGLGQRSAAEVLLRAGVLSGYIGHTRQIDGAQEIAKNLISESITIFETLQEREKVAEAYIEMSICYWRMGAYDEARITLREVLGRLAEEDSELRARVALNSGIVELSAKRYHDALHIMINGAPLFQASSNHALRGKYHVNVGIILNNLSAGEHEEEYRDRALVEYAAASFHFEQAGHTLYRARTENNLGFLLLLSQRYDEAHEHLNRARQLFLRLKDIGTAAQVDDTRARTLIAQGRYVEAERVARAAVRILEQGDAYSPLAEALTTHGTALARLGNYERSRETLQRAIEIAHNAGIYEDAGQAALTMIEELSERLTLEEMQTLYERADQWLAETQHPQTIRRLRQAARQIMDAGRMREKGKEAEKIRPPGFIHVSEQIAKILSNAQRIATTTVSPVLITGETGTGKELLARLIHEWSGRAGEFVTVNCSWLTESLIESQLFGYFKGRFTDTSVNHPGAVRRAAGGTLFLDEITELSRSNQAKLLRLVESGEVQSIGLKELERIDVRIIAATNSNIKAEVKQELFREDLYYRLQPFHLEIPPLRERPEDIPVLVEHFIQEALERYRKQVSFEPQAIEATCQLELRGNVRELRSLIERTVLMAPHEATITRESIEILALRQTKMTDFTDAWVGCVLEEEVRRYEGSLIKLALNAAQGHVTKAARLLGITHQGLAYILKGRQKELLAARTPIRKRRRSITKM